MPKASPLNTSSALRRLPISGVAMAAIAVGAAGLAPAGVGAAELGPLTRVSGGSPFARCSTDRPARQEGELFRNTEIEPFIAADPTDPRNLLAGWQQDRWSNGGARGDVAGVSLNGGASWRTVVIPGVSRCAGGEFLRASDPWVDFSPNGVAYFMSLAFEPDLTSPTGGFLGFGRNAMLVNRSTNGGLSWGDPITLIETDDPRFLNDKNSLTADPTNPSFAYAVWDRLRDFAVPPPDGSPRPGFRGGPVGARERAARLKEAAEAAGRGEQPEQEPDQIFFEGPTLFTRTTNGGRSWERPRVIFDPGPNAQTINNIVVVQPNGTVFDFFTQVFSNGGTRIGFVRSFDKGRTFPGGPRYAATIATVRGVVTPDTQELVRDASILYDPAVDPENGNLYLVWQDVRFRGIDEVAFSMSTDGGGSWSEPVRVNKTPTIRGNPLRGQVFVPSVEVGPGGVLVVTYYDFRNDGSRGELADYWAVFCDPSTADCRNGASWGGELRLTNRSFDMLDAPVARGYFLGDYMGLARAGDAVYPAFGVATGPNLVDLFTRRITFGRRVASTAP
jgi:hypothetical protein